MDRRHQHSDVSHKFKGVGRGSDEESSRLQPLAGVSQHRLGLLLALKRVVIHKLTAADVEHQLGVVQLLRQNVLQGSRPLKRSSTLKVGTTSRALFTLEQSAVMN